MGKISKKIKLFCGGIGIHKIKIDNSNKSFWEFFRTVSKVLEHEKVFVSKQILQEMWQFCQDHNGTISVQNLTGGQSIYSFCDPALKTNSAFLVDSKQTNERQIQLLALTAPYLNYKFHNRTFAKKFYFTKKNEQTNAVLFEKSLENK